MMRATILSRLAVWMVIFASILAIAGGGTLPAALAGDPGSTRTGLIIGACIGLALSQTFGVGAVLLRRYAVLRQRSDAAGRSEPAG